MIRENNKSGDEKRTSSWERENFIINYQNNNSILPAFRNTWASICLAFVNKLSASNFGFSLRGIGYFKDTQR